ncbi:MAG: hypothetical protein KF767_09135 [Bdellovibrionaceae bacterium]|nr:hypothetical protein [Pseudobdellovibrionaceae bacterium]
MAFEAQIDELKGRLQQIGERIAEMPAYQQARDRYETMSPPMQKLSIGGGIALITLVLALIPYSTYSNSQITLGEFQEKRDLIRDLLRTHNEAQSNPPLPRLPDLSEVQSRIDGILNSRQILPEQKKGVTTDAATPLINANLQAGTVRVSLAQLNLRQVTDLSADLASIEGAKLKDIMMDANAKDARYYDVVYRVVVFKSNVPDEPAAPPPAGRGGR